MWRRIVFLFASVLAAEPRLMKLAVNLEFASGSAFSKEGALLVSDSPSGRILRFGATGQSTLHEGLQAAQGLALDDDGRLYVCETRARRVIRVSRGGKPEVIADSYNGKRLNAPNDVVVARNGTVYFTDPAFASSNDTRELPHFGVYRVSPKREVTLLAAMKTRPNGIALAADGKTLYVADSDARAVLSLDATAPGTPKTIVTVPEGVPDGIRLNARGHLYVAAKNLLVYDPSSGKLLETIVMPEKPTGVTFSESILYITAGSSVYKYDPGEAAH